MNWKKIATWTLVIFALYMVFARPDRAASLVQDGINLVADAGQSVADFFDALVA